MSAPPPTASAAPSISVIVPHYQDLANLDLCLAALGAQTLAPLEIVVADNGSPAGEAAVLKAIAGRARLVLAPQRGAGAARNAAVAAARGEILAFTDADCRPQSGWLAAGVERLKSCDLAGGQMIVLSQDPASRTGPEAFETIFAFRNEDYVTRKNFTVTANLFCSRRVFEAVGPFDVTGVSEDAEWCLRARDRGFVIGYAPEAVVGHPARRTWDELTRKWRRLDEETFALERNRGAPRAAWWLRCLGLPVSALIHTPKALTARGLTARERVAATGVLWRLRFWRAADCLRLALSA